MSDEDLPAEALTPAERRLAGHLDLLRDSGPEPSRALVRRVVRTARWQRTLRMPLRVAGMIAGAFVDGLSRLIRTRAEGGR